MSVLTVEKTPGSSVCLTKLRSGVSGGAAACFQTVVRPSGPFRGCWSSVNGIIVILEQSTAIRIEGRLNGGQPGLLCLHE